MKNITIKKDETLIKLAEFLNKKPDWLIEHILSVAGRYQYIVDDICDLDHEFIDLFLQYRDLMTKSGACLICTGSYEPEAIELFCNLKLWGTGNCPECGCESEESELHPNQMIQIGHDSPPELAGYDNRVCLHCNYEFKI